MPSRPPPLVLLCPIAPAASGNGLAMRVELFRAAAAHDFDVHVVVVPVAGRVPGAPADRVVGCTVIGPGTASHRRSELGRLLADPEWRRLLAVTPPWPERARWAPPTLADDVVAALPPGHRGPGVPVHVTRCYLAPLGVALAHRLAAPWSSLDLDDDDEQVARTLGQADEAAGYGRMVGAFGPLFGAVALAAPAEASAVSDRHGFPARVVPNAVRVPPRRTPRARPRPGRTPSLLFVGNLTYRPNAEAARHLVDEVLPRLRSALGGAVTLTLVGDTGPDPEARALGARPGVRVTGFAPDLEAYYAAADVVVAPITTAGGTRIKLLEAFVHGVPVVTTRAGAAGLDVRDGVHLLLARSAAEFADQVARLVDDGELGPALGTAAAHLVRTRYSHDAVVPQVRAFFRAAAG